AANGYGVAPRAHRRRHRPDRSNRPGRPVLRSADVAKIRSGESGIAMIVALFMVLVLSVLAASLIFVARTETFSSLNYRTMAEARYGAESGVHSAVNHILWTYTPPEAASATDPISNYNIN